MSSSAETVKHLALSNELRRRIVKGGLRPGARVPNRTQLLREFDVSIDTVQRAMRQLIVDGFIRSRPGAGTFVVDRPPHLSTFGLVMADTVATGSRFYEAIRLACGNYVARTRRAPDGASTTASPVGFRPTQFREYAVSADIHRLDTLNQLCADVTNCRVGGLIFATPPFELRGTVALRAPRLPRVIIGPDGSSFRLPAVGFGVERFARRAVEYLRGRGRRRIAHVRGDAVHVDPVAFSKELKRLGGEVRPYWVHLVPVGVNFRSASEIVNLLMQLEGGKRPDALVIHDDNMIEPVTAGLLRAGVKVPDDLEIVAHTNWPAPVASQLPMTRLGFDCDELVAACVEVLGTRHNNRTPAEPRLFGPRFEHERKNASQESHHEN